MSNRLPHVIFTQVIDRPARKLILKRGREATHYYDYCEEVGCDVWGVLSNIPQAIHEAVGIWLPDNLRPAGTAVYALGVEIPADYAGTVPQGYDIIDLPPCKLLVMQGQPFDDEKMDEAIGEFWQDTKDFNPEPYGYEWADTLAPKLQLAPIGSRGCIEARPIKQLKKSAV